MEQQVWYHNTILGEVRRSNCTEEGAAELMNDTTLEYLIYFIWE